MSRHPQFIEQSIEQFLGDVTLGDDSTANVGIFHSYLGSEQRSAQQALSFPEMYNRLHEIPDATFGTCSWIIRNTDFEKWVNAQCRLLWIKGKPGTGKSTIMKYLWENRLKLQAITASFFCHGRGVDLQKSPSGLFRALLHQIVQQVPSLQENFEERYQARCGMQGSHGSAWNWMESELRNFAKDYILEACRYSNLLIYIDALDECGEDNARKLLDFFRVAVADAETLKGGRLKILVSSRHYPLSRLNATHELILDGKNLADIRIYVAQKLDLFREGNLRHDELLSSITSRTGEIFQWCVVVVPRVAKSLERMKPVELILQEVQETPEELFQLYRQIVRLCMDEASTNSQDKRQSSDMFRWVALAKRPLEVRELRSAVSIDHFHQHTGDQRAQIEYMSCGLAKTVEVKEPDHSSGRRYHRLVVEFIHLSVQEYFISGGGLQDLRESGSATTATHMAELDIVRVCYKSVLLSDPNADAHAQHPLLNYSLCYMFHHARSAEEGQPMQKNLTEILNFPKDDCVAILAKFDSPELESQNYGLRQNLLHIAASFDIPNLVSSVLNLAPGMSINVRCSRNKTALHIAAETGSCNAIDRLLNISQTLTSEPMLLLQRRGLRALDLNIRDLDERTPLMRAAELGHRKIVEQLAQTRRADLDMKSPGGGFTALHLAIISDHVDTAKVLIHHGANIRATDYWRRTPLSHTLHRALMGRVEHKKREMFAFFWFILSQSKQELYLKSVGERPRPYKLRPFGLSPLERGLSSETKSLEFARGLIDKGFDPNQPDQYGCVWLLFLSPSSKPGTLDLLLAQPGANVNSKDRNGRTLLARLASSKGTNCLMIKRLLENHETDVRTSDKHGKTPLMIAAKEGHIAIFKVLLADVRCDPQARDKNNLCALDYAKERKINAQNNFIDPNDRGSPPSFSSRAEEEADAIITLLESSCANYSLARHPDPTDTTRAGIQATWNVKKRIRFLLSSLRTSTN